MKSLSILLALLVAGTAGCATETGVVMSADEATACRTQGCTAWTEAELRRLIGKVFSDGYRKGATDAGKGI